MPLLGRHKSSSSSAAAAAAAATAATAAVASSQTVSSSPQQQVCDSPLFGLRKQLDLSTNNHHHQQQQHHTGGGGEMTSSGELSSIPQQITRQQIHYAFSIMDTNQDGLIDLRDLSQMLANLGVPIDEAILSHIMSTVSKRGDHRVSEKEFLEWISQFIQINDGPKLTTAPPTSRSASPGSARSPARRPFSAISSRVHRSSTASSSLAAQPAEVPRSRRGSGSGLALMRSLSASSTASSAAASAGSQLPEQVRPEQVASDSDARDDLKAAFCVFDLDGDGFITLDEVQAGLRLLGEESWTPTELRRLFSKCSSSSTSSTSSANLSNQRISIDDFVQLLL